MNTANFTIQRQDNILSVKLKGRWSLTHDLSYMTELSEQVSQINRAPWSMMINMLDWELDDVPVMSNDKHVAEVYLDRRNQIAEAWVVRNTIQARSLIKYIEAAPNLKFKRFLTISEANAWLSKMQKMDKNEHALSKGSFNCALD